MALILLKTILFRLVLPAALLFGALIRPSFISITYVIFALIGPLLAPISSSASISPVLRIYFFIVLLVSLAAAISQFSYQIYETVAEPVIDVYTRTCNSSIFHFWMRQMGLIRIKSGAGFDSVRVILPEILALVSSLGTTICCLALPQNGDQENAHRIADVQPVRDSSSERRESNKIHIAVALLLALKKLSDVAIILFVGLVGILQPCLLNSMYFVAFLFVLTWWASYTPLRRNVYNTIKLLIICYTGLHFLLIYIYQIPFFQIIIPGQSFVARFCGFVPLVYTNCDHWWTLEIISRDYWTAFANGLFVLVLYHLLIMQYGFTRYGIQHEYASYESTGSSVHEENVAMSVYRTSQGAGDESELAEMRSDERNAEIEEQRDYSLLGNDDESQRPENVPMQKITPSEVDRHKIALVFVGPDGSETTASQGVIAALAFFFHHCYVFALFAIMFWALLYHSVFGLVFLLEACIPWLFKDTRNVAFRQSPFLLAYAEFLLLAQYVCSMDIKQDLPQSSYLELVGFVIADTRASAFVTLLAKGLLSLPLFALLRLHRREKYYSSLSEHEPSKQLHGTYITTAINSDRVPYTEEAVPGTSHQDTPLSVKLVSWLSECFATYWIYVVSLVLLLISIQTPPVLYTVGFFISFSLLVTFLLVSLTCLRRSLYGFWTFLVVYSSLVLVILYCYQFPSIPSFWRNGTGLSDDWNHDIGLINYKQEGDTGALFIRLIAPISFFIVAMLQLKFFHNFWCRLVTASPGQTQNNSSAEIPNDQSSYYVRAKHIADCIMEALWSIAEVHVAKLVMLVLVIVAVNDICALNLVVIIFISLAVCLPGISSALSLFLCLFVSIFAVLRMVYQMHFVVEKSLPVYSEDLICNSTEFDFDDTAHWLGFRKVSVIGDYLGGLIIILLALAFQAIVIYRQQHKRLVSGASIPARGIVFPEADPRNWDASLLDMVKFFFNYGFYKFGLEISMTMMVVVAWVRMDLLGTLLLIWLMIFTFTSRITCRRLWPLFLLYLAVLFPLQYALYVGIPRFLCIDYPWSHWLSNPLQNDNLVFWLDLASYRVQLDVKNSIADFFLLVMVACQEYAFRNENISPAGDNKSIYRDGFDAYQNNPTYDFITEQRSFVDFLKIIVFMYGHWITIVMVLVAGLGGVSLFALGYIILAFWMLWKGNSLYLMVNYRRALARWRLLLYYTVFVMFCKVYLQVFACVFIHLLMQANLCYIRQLFSIVCVSTAPGRTSNYYFPEQQEFDNECTVQKSETQIGFDTFAFAFLVFQLRIFNSFYFQHCIVEYRSEAVLMNRGAVLQNQLIEKEMREQNEQQEKKFRDIKIRTEQIRKDYEKRLSRAGAFVPQTYGQGIDSPDPDDPSPWYSLSDTRQRVDDLTPAKRAGDYYMFEYDPSQDALDEPVATFVPEVTPGAGDFYKLDPAQLMHTAVQHDLDLAGTLAAVESAEQMKGDEERRMIAAVSEQKPQSRAQSPAGDEPKPKFGSQIVATLHFVQKLLVSALDWFAAFLNRRSREHRYVAYVLGKEKEKLKENLKQPLVDASRPVLDVRQEFDQQNLQCVSSASDIERLEGEVQDNWQQRNVFARFITALGYCIAAHTDVICYLLAIIDHARCAGIISLPLPLLVFFWGSLTNPRPSKTFWVLMITYTELVVVIKFICQFGFFAWNNTANIIRAANSADYIPGILGVRKTDYYAFWDIALLVALFFHRYMLRKLGLWKESTGAYEINPSTAPLDNSVTTSSLPDGSQADSQLDVVPAVQENPGCLQRIKNYCNMLFHPKVRYIRDLYPFMFLLDVICFFVVSFGFSSFGYGGSGSVVRDISSNRVPITFVVMLIIISLMIVIDRALYLRKAVKCKYAYQLIIIIFIHIWIFFVLPTITYQPAWLNKTAQFLYIVKCIYLLISAWQIRNGYPVLCSGNLITHAYGLPNMVFFKLFMGIPFLFELRTAIDWTWTDTSMPLFDFFNMENFYAVIYNLKCARNFERSFPAPRGVPKGVIVKYSMGVPMILVLILIIWLPLLAFSLLNRIGIILPPNNVMLTIGVEGYPALFKMEAQGIDLEFLTNSEYQKLQDAFAAQYISSDSDSILMARQAVAFIKEYTLEDIMKVRFRPESQQPWLISNDALVAMKYELTEGKKELNAFMKFTYERPTSKESKDPSQHSYTLSIPLAVNSSIRNDLATILTGQYNESILLEQAWPPYVIVPNEGDVKPALSLLNVMSEPNLTAQAAFFNVSMKLKLSSVANRVWSAEMIENNKTAGLVLPLEDVRYEAHSEKYMLMVAFVDRVFPSFVTKYVQGGIIAMYIAVVMLVGRMIRGVVTNAPLEVMISEIPNPDYLLKTCHDIYLVREAKDFILEQDLFGKLIFLFRSPATLIKWTRNKAKAD